MPLFGFTNGTERIPVYAKGGVLDPKRCYADARGWVYRHPNGIHEVLQTISGLADSLGAGNVMSIAIVARDVDSDDLSFLVTLNEAATVTGTPTFTIAGTGLTGTGVLAYVSGSTTNQLLFTYAPVAGDVMQAASITMAQTTIVLAGGTIVDTVTGTNIGAADLTAQGADGSTNVKTPLATLYAAELVQYGANVRSIGIASDAIGTDRTAATDDLFVILGFNEAVDVDESGGTPILTVVAASGTGFNTDGVVTYVSGTGTNSLVFSKAAESGDDAITITLPAVIDLNSGTILNSAGSGGAIVLSLEAAGADHATNLTTAAEVLMDADGGMVTA